MQLTAEKKNANEKGNMIPEVVRSQNNKLSVYAFNHPSFEVLIDVGFPTSKFSKALMLLVKTSSLQREGNIRIFKHKFCGKRGLKSLSRLQLYNASQGRELP